MRELREWLRLLFSFLGMTVEYGRMKKAGR
jgi:hypothetical protein